MQFVQFKVPLIAMLLVSLAACSRPYSPPEIRGAMSFAGASDLAADSKRVRVIMTHGMCSQSHQAFGGPGQNWVADRSETIAGLVGDTGYTRQQQYKPVKEYKGTSRSPAVSRYDLNIHAADGTTYELKMLKWGQSFWPAFNALDILEAEIQKPPITRASLNHSLKTELMDNCLVDAVAYGGSRGDSLRSAYREAMCDLMGGKISGANTGRPNEKVTCSGMASGSQVPAILVPESLGSKIMMDAILSIKGGNKEGALGSVRAIHLATNQIPLLSQAQASENTVRNSTGQGGEPGANDFRTLVRQLSSRNTSRAISEPISVVVYSDPNDLIGYPLTKEWIPDDGTAQLTNVLISNGSTYFGSIANPASAHSGTARPEVFKMIIHGSDTQI
ncbi:hypothetical protein [Leisingera sp. ANG-M7]|uniref:hypothetical protein n=1 Tax=Leisingera sp. ANG-M7 TaxID=1577902 RepID=UPI00057EDDBB|nr:hypothetical protein [Leisingera sp. ANG-M7]KIC36813.1 hypothetical protein RA26_10840 [Leisingera sp. ANG-M7]